MNGSATARRWADRLLGPAPAERLAAVRILVGGYALAYLVVRTPHLVDLAGLPRHRWHPVGLLGTMASPPPGALAAFVLAVTIVAGIGFTAGWGWRLTGPTFALGTLVTTTYGASFGHILHTENLMVLHLVVLAGAPAADAWVIAMPPLEPWCPARAPAPPPAARYGFPLRLLALVTVLTYAIAGWAKLRNGGDGWLTGDGLRNQVAFDNLRKVLLGDRWSPLGARLVATRWLWPPVAWATLAVELGAPLALLHHRWRAAWAGAAWTFHLGTWALMAILFPYPLSGVAFVSLFPVEGGVRRVGAWVRRRGAGRPGTHRPPRRHQASLPLPAAVPGPADRSETGPPGER